MGVSIGTKTLNWTCGLFATLLGISAVLVSLVCLYVAWLAWNLDSWLGVACAAAVGVLAMTVPVLFVQQYDQWQTRKGLQ